ncbi:MAG: DUF3299 domain-containing protein [Pseudomonadota bacterium]
MIKLLLNCLRFSLLPILAGMASIGIAYADTGIAPPSRMDSQADIPGAASTRPSTYQLLKWKDLIPANWDPAKPLKGMNFDRLDDSDPRAIEALKKLREVWDKAPTNPGLNGKSVKIPGFVIPLDPVRDGNIKEFLLVPYFGACIHTPPPPSNQIIHVISPTPLSKEQQKVLFASAARNGAISVSGTLQIVNAKTSMAVSGYRLKASDLAHYFYKGSLDNPTR